MEKSVNVGNPGLCTGLYRNIIARPKLLPFPYPALYHLPLQLSSGSRCHHPLSCQSSIGILALLCPLPNPHHLPLQYHNSGNWTIFNVPQDSNLLILKEISSFFKFLRLFCSFSVKIQREKKL